jgi:pimeloyl-ACP methyl ester carboxylesterase
MSQNTGHACVVLVHGLWMNAAALSLLQMRVRRCGFSVARFGYPTVRAGLAESAARLSKYLKSLDASEICVVAHSMGGLVTLRALELNANPRVRSIVLIGSPVAGSLAGRRLAKFPAGRMLMGANSSVWGVRQAVKAPAGVTVGVIAGTMSLGLGRLVGKLPRPNDGVVSVAETQLNNAADTILLHVSHSAMLFSAGVARQVCHFLKHACFLHDSGH